MIISVRFIKLVDYLKAFIQTLSSMAQFYSKWNGCRQRKLITGSTHFYISLSLSPQSSHCNPSLPEIELWKFDQGLNLKSARLFLHFNSNLRDGEQGNQRGIYCVDERSCGRMVLFSLSISSSWLSPCCTRGWETCFPPTHTHSGKVDRLHLMVADTCEHTVLKAAYHKDDEMVNVVTVSAAT